MLQTVFGSISIAIGVGIAFTALKELFNTLERIVKERESRVSLLFPFFIELSCLLISIVFLLIGFTATNLVRLVYLS